MTIIEYVMIKISKEVLIIRKWKLDKHHTFNLVSVNLPALPLQKIDSSYNLVLAV